MKREMKIEELFENIGEVWIDTQVDFDQVGVWLKLYGEHVSICYQNGDMNGESMGQAVFDNEGADDGPGDVVRALRKQNWDLTESQLQDLASDFLEAFSEKNGIEETIKGFEEARLARLEEDEED